MRGEKNMRLYTIESENKQYVAVEGKDGRPVALDSSAEVKTKEELVDKIKKRIERERER